MKYRKLNKSIITISFFICISFASDSFCEFSSARELMFDYKLNSALTAFSRIKKEQKKYLQARINMGLICEKLAKFNEAKKYFRDVMENDKENRYKGFVQWHLKYCKNIYIKESQKLRDIKTGCVLQDLADRKLEALSNDTSRRGKFIIVSHNKHIGELVEKSLEKNVRKIFDTFLNRGYTNWNTKKRIVFIFYDAQEFAAETGSNALAFCRYIPKQGQQMLCFNQSDGELLDNTIPHELTHAVLFEIIGPGVANLLWLHEGTASYHEYRMGYYKRLVRKAIENGEYIPIRELFYMKKYPDTSKMNTLFYAESASVVDFLVNCYGKDNFGLFISFMSRLRDYNYDTVRILRGVYAHDFNLNNLTDFERKWKAYVRGNYKT